MYSLAFQRHREVDRQLRSRVPRPRQHDPRPPASGGADPAAVVLGVPDDVRGDHARAHHRCDRRPHEVLGVVLVHRALGAAWCTRRSRTGCSHPPGGCSAAARSTSPAAPSCTSTPGIAALVAVLVIGRRRGLAGPPVAAALAAAHAARHRHPLVRLVRLQRRFRARRQRHRRPGVHEHARWRPRPPCSAGCCSSASAASTRRRWARRRARSPGLVAITPCAGFVGPHGRDRHRLHRRWRSASSR